MKIALYFPWLQATGGAEKTILEHVKRSKHDITIYTNFYDPKLTFPEFKQLKVVALNQKKLAKASYLQVFKICIANLFTKIPLEKYDAFLVHTSGFGELSTIFNKKIPTAVFCHTILRGLRDSKELYFSRYPQPIRLFALLSAQIYAFFEKLAWKNFSVVACNSNNTRNRIAKAKLAENIKVIHPGVNPEEFSPGRFDKYFLTVGRINFYKRTLLAIESFKEFKKQNKRFKLVIAGSIGKKDEAYFEEVKKAIDNDSDIKLVLNASTSEIKKLYENCYAFLFTAHDEDWGLVNLESMVAGKPVISVAEGGPLEQVKNGETGFLVKADATLFAEKMSLLARDEKLARKMGSLGRARVKRYSWDIYAKEMDNAIDSLFRKVNKY